MDKPIPMTPRIIRAKEGFDEAQKALEAYGDIIEALPSETKDDERDFHAEELRKLEEARERAQEKLEREITFQRGREMSAFLLKDSGVQVGEEPKTYHPGSGHSYFRDLVAVQAPQLGIPANGAAERLARHGKEMSVDREQRDVTSGDPGTSTFIPPLYLG